MNKDKQEKPWTIMSWGELREALATMQPKSKLYEIVKAEVQKRDHWKRTTKNMSRK